MSEYEYKNVKVDSLRNGRRGRRAQDKLMNKMAAEGWEVIDAQRLGRWEFGSKDTLVFRRPKPEPAPRPPRAAEPGTAPQVTWATMPKWVYVAGAVIMIAIVGSLFTPGEDQPSSTEAPVVDAEDQAPEPDSRASDISNYPDDMQEMIATISSSGTHLIIETRYGSRDNPDAQGHGATMCFHAQALGWEGSIEVMARNGVAAGTKRSAVEEHHCFGRDSLR